MSGTRERLNAVFLAAVMVLSMVAMSATFAAPAAAQAGNFGGNTGFVSDQILEDDLEVTISDADFSQESAVVITKNSPSSPDEVVGVNESLSATNFNGNNDVQVELTGNLDTDLSTDNYDAYGIEQGSTVPSVGDDYSNGDSPDQFTTNQNVRVFHTAYSVEGVEGPVSTFDGAEVDVTANVTNLGVADNTEDIEITDDNDGDNQVTTVEITGIDGDFEEFTFEDINTATLGNADPAGINTESLTVRTDATADTAATTQNVEFTVGTDEEGEVFVDVRNADAGFNAVQGATVNISDSSTGNQIAQAQTPASGTVSFDGLAVSGDQDNPEQYTVQASAPELELNSDSTVAELFADGDSVQRETTVQLNLRSNLDAQFVDVVNFDDETNTVAGEDAALFANGEFENTNQFAVVTQNQQNDALGTSSLDVTVEFTGTDPDGTNLDAGAYDSTFGEGPGSFANNNEAVRTLTLTVDGSSESIPVDDISNADQIQNASGDSPVGNLSVATFNVTSALANETTLNDPVITETFTAEATNSSGNVLGTDSGIDASRNGNNVTYFLEGDTKISGQVLSLDNGEAVYPNATVYIAYSGGPQDLSTIESFENDQGVAFLTAEPNENGDYIIDGVVEEAIDGSDDLEANLYVVSEGFNRFNMTNEPAPLSGTFAAEYVAPINKTDIEQTGNTFQFAFAHVLDETALAFDLNVTAEDTTLDEQVKDARVGAGEESVIEVSVQQGDVGTTPDSVAPNQQVEVELTDDNIAGELVNADNDGVVTTQTNGNGVAEIIFEADGTQSVETAATLSSNVTASTVNVAGDEFNTTADDPRSFNNEANQSRLTVFATGQITGDVVDAADTNIPATSPEFDVEVELFQRNDASGSFDIFVDNTTTGDDGSFSFVGVPTGQDYRAVATVTRTATGGQETGTSRTVENLQPVTENADIVVEELVLEEVFVINSVEDAQANTGEEVTVNATISNIIDEEATQNVTLTVDGVEEETQEVLIPASETETVEFTFTAPEEADNYELEVSSGSSSQTATLNVTAGEAGTATASASVAFPNQSVTNGTEEVTIDSADFTRNGSAGEYVVVVHTINEFGAPVGEVSRPTGASGDLTGAEENITVNLTNASGPINNITEDVTLRAMLHTTANDRPFGNRLGNAINGIERGGETDDAIITVEQEQQNQTDEVVSEVNFNDAAVADGSTTLTVDNATHDEDFVIVAHTADAGQGESVQPGDIGRKIGQSTIQPNGTQENIAVNLSKDVSGDDNISSLAAGDDQQIVMMLHVANANANTTAAPDRNYGSSVKQADGETPVFDNNFVSVSSLDGAAGNADADGDGEISQDEVQTAIREFIVDDTLTRSQAQDVIRAFIV